MPHIYEYIAHALGNAQSSMPTITSKAADVSVKKNRLLKTMKLATVIVAAVVGCSAHAFAQAPLTVGASDGPVTIVGASLNGTGSNQAHVGPGQQFTLQFQYTIVDTACPGCMDQIEVGLTNSDPSTCAYSGSPNTGVSDTSSVLTFTAPTTPGTYYVAFDRSQAYGCSLSGWWNGPPQASQYIAAINVH